MAAAVSVAPEVGVAPVASPVGVLELDTHSSSEADPSKSLQPPVYVAPMVLLFLCTNDSESDTEMPKKHVSHTPHDAMLTSIEVPTTSLGILFWVIPYLDIHHQTPPLLIQLHHRDLFIHHLLGLHDGEAYLRWRSALLSTLYPSTTSESSAGDSSSESSVGPSFPYRVDLFPPHKRFRDSILPEDSVEEDINADELADIEAGDMAIEVIVDRDVEAGVDASIGMEVDVWIDVGDEVQDEVESCDRGTIEVRVDVVVGIDIFNGLLIPDAVERLEQVEEGLQDIYKHVIEIPLQRIVDIETGQRELEVRSLIAGGERASLLEQVASLERSNMRLRGTIMMKSARANRFQRHMSFMESELRQIHRFRYYDRMQFKRLETFAAKRLEHVYHLFCDGDNGNGGNGNPNENDRGARPVARECTYQDFVKYQPLNFKEMEGVVRLIRWFEKMETLFYISNCPEKYQVKYATCTFLNIALTWWNSHKRTIGTEAAFAMS
nr:reverse transcriptase domain-containing protein [Tanacetum cinerariifolium]